MTRQQALARIAEMQKLIGGFGIPDTDALTRSKAHIFALRQSGHGNGYFREKLNSFERWIEIGFSAQKFQRLSGGLLHVNARATGDGSMMQRLIEENWPET